MNERNERQPSGLLKFVNMGASDWFKALGLFAFVVASWVRMESGLSAINNRLDRIEASQAGFVRSDVAQARNETLGAKLDSVNLRLERIEMKIDFQDRDNARR